MISRKLAIALFLCSFLQASAVSLGADLADLFVAPDGDDSHAGTFEVPFATFERARDAIREIKQSGGLPDGGITVYLRAGVYRLEDTFELLKQDSGEPGRRIVYRNYEDERVRLMGGVALDAASFESVTDEAVLKRIPQEAHDQVLQIDLRAQGITDFGQHTQYGFGVPVVPANLELFFEDEAMPLARYPNEGSILIGKVIDPGSNPRMRDYSERGGTFEYTDPRHERWVGVEDVWLQGTFMYGYADDKIRVESIDPATHQVTLATPHLYSLGSGQPYQQYVVLNILEELDSPGEWYVDRKTGMLYFWPPADIKQSRIVVSLLEAPLVALDGASYVTLRGLTIEVGRGIGVYLEGGSHNLIAGCTVRNLGTSGIFMGQGARQTFPHLTHDDYEGVPVSRDIGSLLGQIYKYTTWDRHVGNNNGVVSCDVYNTGTGGIYLDGGSKKDLIPGHCYVVNCRVHDYTRRNKFLWSGVSINGCGNRIAHCEIYGSDFHGIYAHGNEHIYEYNYIHDVAMDSFDTSGWYLGRDPSDRGNVIRNNLFANIGRPDRMVFAIYFDDGTCDVTVHGNVFYRAGTRAAVFSNAGSDLRVTNNIIVETKTSAMEVSSFWYFWAGPTEKAMFAPGGEYPHRLAELVDYKHPPYSTCYPELGEWLDPIVEGKEWVGMRPRRNLMLRNVVVNTPNVVQFMGDHAQCEERGNLHLDSDPGFVDAAHGNFSLREDSIVYQELPGFEPIPFDQIGLYEDEYRRHLD